jgi:beta-lactamase superfamily II metal-dependent hydrolase
MRDQQTHSLLRIVSSLEDALNNASIILLLQSGTRRLLFPGDAQIENWSYSLTSTSSTAKALRAEIGTLDLYKVGHHGSRNASPRSLLTMWQQPHTRPFVSMMSTLPHVHVRRRRLLFPGRRW